MGKIFDEFTKQHNNKPDLFLLSYDKSTKKNDTEMISEALAAFNEAKRQVEFRRKLVRYLLEVDSDCELTSPVASTMYISSRFKELEDFTEMLISIEDFHFTIAKVYRDVQGNLEYSSLIDEDFEATFNDIVAKIRTEI